MLLVLRHGQDKKGNRATKQRQTHSICPGSDLFLCPLLCPLTILEVADPPAASTATQEEEHFQLFKKGPLTHNSRTAEKQVPQRMPEWETQHKGSPGSLTDIMRNESFHLRMPLLVLLLPLFRVNE